MGLGSLQIRIMSSIDFPARPFSTLSENGLSVRENTYYAIAFLSSSSGFYTSITTVNNVRIYMGSVSRLQLAIMDMSGKRWAKSYRVWAILPA